MKYCIAMDGGGTKTDSVLFDETGHILWRDVSKGSNGMDIGKEEACRRVLAALRRVLAKAPDEVCTVYGGLAGILPLGDYMSETLLKHIKVGSLRLDDDGCNLISGTLGRADGCGMVAGTGSSLFARVTGQPLIHLGGKGYLIDTGGSGFELGRDALCAAFRTHDGRRGPTVLTELIRERIGKPLDDSFIAEIYHPERGGRAFIASFAGLVFEGRRQGDAVCEAIFERGASLLADLTHAVERYFPGDFSVVMGGGLFFAFPEYAQAVTEKASPRAQMIRAAVPPVWGAAVEAAWDAGLPVTDAFRERFLADYTAWQEKA